MGVDPYYKSRTRSSSVGTVIGIALVLFMLGILGYLLLNARAVEQWVKENLRVEIFLKHDVKETEVMKFRKELDTQPFTRETRYVTADEAAERLKADLGEDFLGVLGANPLLPSIELNLNGAYAQPDSLAWITAWMEKDPRVEEVKYNKDVVENISSNMRKLGVLLLGFAALLLVIAIALINNTIRLAIYSRRFLIRTMHLTGATQWFIKKPFLGQSLWHGLVASVLAIGLLTATVRLITHFVPDLRALIDPVMLAQLFIGTVVLGLLISLISTWFAVRRYLRMNIDELNWELIPKAFTMAKTPVKTPDELPFMRTNYRLLLIGLAIIVVGYILMSGGGNGDPNAFDAKEIFSPRRITVAPIVCLIGYLFVIYAIMKRVPANEA